MIQNDRSRERCAAAIFGKLVGSFFGFGTRRRYSVLDVAGASRRLGEPGEAVGAPFLAADAVVDEEQTVGVVCPLHLAQASIIGAPEGGMPVALEEIALRYVGSCVRHNFAQLVPAAAMAAACSRAVARSGEPVSRSL